MERPHDTAGQAASRRPLVSVIIPCHNYARFLPASAGSALEQACPELAVEVIVVDDGSTDRTPQAAAALGDGVRYIRQEQQGLSAARNTGIRAARGQYVQFLDADDLLAPGSLTGQLRYLAAHPDLDAGVCLCLTTGFGGRTAEDRLWQLKAAHLDLFLCHGNIAPVHAFFLRREAVRRAGLFDESLRACEDQDYWLRCVAAGCRLGSNPDALVVYRQHDGSLSASQAGQLRHDLAMQFRISRLLADAGGFPTAGKYLGYLAHAAGGMFYGINAAPVWPEEAMRLLREAGTALLEAMRCRQAVANAYLAEAEQLFAAQFLAQARTAAAQLALPELRQALRLATVAFPKMAGLDEAALARLAEARIRALCCDRRRVRATLGRHAALIRELLRGGD